MTQPRLLPDYAAVPTKRERNAARASNRAAQLGMFERFADDLLTLADEPPSACPVCGGDHAGPCPHGTAPQLPDNSPETVEARRQMFGALGWTR